MAGVVLLAGCPHDAARTGPAATARAPADAAAVVEMPLPQILASAKRLQDRPVRTSGYPDRVGRGGSRWWRFTLRSGDAAVVCYELRWHSGRHGLVQQLLRHAEVEGQPVRVAGRLQQGARIELDWIEVYGQRFDTDVEGPNVNGLRRL